METKYGSSKNIPKVFSIHHINGDTTNDGIENLLLMGKIDHQRLHMPRDYSRYGVSSTESPAAYQRARYADTGIKEERLTKKRKYYQEKLKNDPDYITENRYRAGIQYLKKKERKRNEN
jgi:hypothetical protein